MAELVGITLGAVSLAGAVSGTFVSILNCFEYVELGRRFTKDFERSQAQLGRLKLQLTNWGTSAGAFPDPQTKKFRAVTVDFQTAFIV